jgi:two-component system phosphate regulon sensor histidine kinase PhoR
MLGYAMDAAIPDAIIGRDVLSPHIDYDAWEDEVEQHLQQQGLWQSELTLSRLDGSQLTAYVYITAVYNPDGQQRGIVSILRDISQAKRLQEQKDRFISNASHELRTPITNIQTRLFLIRKRPEHTQEHLKVIEDVTKHMADLIKDLRDLSRFERGIMHISRTTVVVQDLLQQVIQVQQAEALQKDIQLSLLAPPDPLILALDASRMTQVLTNLIINAISYTDPQGSVTVTLQPLPSDQLLIEVADTGIGIAPDLLNQVFQPFFRAQQGKGSGAGLGLNIAKEIVEAHGGQLQVRSELNNGSVFSILLPMITP